MKKFSIITICLNMEDEIANTITSVLNQTCIDYEYLIKDGLSQDRTVRIAESFAPAFAERGIPYRTISGSDSGIYDAMNQAVSEAQGEWVLYMNAGDLFADQYVLEMVEKSGKLETADIVYGDAIDRKDEDGYFYRKAYPLERMRDRLPFCHQSVFVSQRLYDQLAYSLRYRLCSDYLFFYHWYQAGKRFACLPIAISIYDRHGASSNGRAVAQELLKIHEDMPVRDEETIQMLKKEVAGYDKKPSVLRRIWVRCVPPQIRKKRWMRILRKKGWKTAEEFLLEKERNGGRVNKLI
ncbi:MAG: glycosyltransferase family 2 protein [bacterium]|nr:glycosyltransferase family 2 protein [bacterium]